MTGCTVTFTQSDTLQLSLSDPAEETMSIVAEFEAGEADSVAGDVTQKSRECLCRWRVYYLLAACRLL